MRVVGMEKCKAHRLAEQPGEASRGRQREHGADRQVERAVANTMRAKAGQALDLIARARTRASGPPHSVQRRLNRLNARVTELEDEIQECRRLNRRLAELTDVVEELLVPLSQRDETEVRRLLDRYSAQL